MGDKIKDFLLIIPARCGSKGIKSKNIVELNGHPLIYYTIRVAKKLKVMKLVDEIYISTDCEEIKQVCESLGLKVTALRDKNLSTDKAKTVDLIRAIINQYLIKNIYFKHILLLQPTSPLRTFNQVSKSIEMYLDHNNNSLISVCEDSSLSDDILYFKNGLSLTPKKITHNSGKRRQENKVIHIRNGAIYIVKTEYFMKYNSMICDKPLGFVMDKITSINIDEHIDLEIAKRLL